jgi:Spy/CpxP family protein refolding chaperone
MKKTAIVLILGVITIASVAAFSAFGGPPGPPPGDLMRGSEFSGGPPGPPPGHMPGHLQRGGEFFGGPPGPPSRGGAFSGLLDGPRHLMGALKLTDDQQKQMRLTYVGFLDSTRKARKGLMGLDDEKAAMLISGKIDLAKLAKLDEETAKLASEVMGEDLKMKREQLALLTPEQIDHLADFSSKRRPGRGHHGPPPMMKGR